MYYYLLFLLILIPFMGFAAWASAKVNTAYSKYDKVPNAARMTVRHRDAPVEAARRKRHCGGACER